MDRKRDKQEARKLLILGLVFADRYEHERALNLFAEALTQDPALVAAHIARGFTYGQSGAYAEMFSTFREAVRIDPLSARVAVVKREEEVDLIYRILNPPDPSLSNEGYESAMPAEFVDAGNLIGAGMDYIAEGHDEEAIEALEQSLWLDPQSDFAVSLLTLTYLLVLEKSAVLSIAIKDSVLWSVAPIVAKQLFK